MPLDFPKICATCKHLKPLEEGREFEKIIDTEYTIFTCEVLGWKTKEFYLMAPIGDIFASMRDYKECPYWEYWDEEKDDLKNKKKGI